MSDPGLILRFEITVASMILDATDKPIGGNLSDATFAFEASVKDPQRPLSDAEVNGALAEQMGKVLSVLRAVLPQVGLTFAGEVDGRMLDHAHAVGTGKTPEVRVVLHTGPEARA